MWGESAAGLVAQGERYYTRRLRLIRSAKLVSITQPSRGCYCIGLHGVPKIGAKLSCNQLGTPFVIGRKHFVFLPYFFELELQISPRQLTLVS